MSLIDGDRIITAQLYDDEYEEYTEKKMSIIDFINAFSDEGVTTADDVLGNIENEISRLDNLNPNYLSDGVIAIDKHEVYKIIDKYKAGKRVNDQNNEQINKMYD